MSTTTTTNPLPITETDKTSNICEHGRRRYTCKKCGGKGICSHGRQRYQCKDCGGGGICTHKRIRSQCKGKYSKRSRSNVAVILVRIVFISSFLFDCLFFNHSFQTNPNSITNCFQFILFYLQLYKLHLLNAFVYFDF